MSRNFLSPSPPQKFCETSWPLGMAKTTFPGHHETLKFSVSSLFYRSDSYSLGFGVFTDFRKLYMKFKNGCHFDMCDSVTL